MCYHFFRIGSGSDDGEEEVYLIWIGEIIICDNEKSIAMVFLKGGVWRDFLKIGCKSQNLDLGSI